MGDVKINSCPTVHEPLKVDRAMHSDTRWLKNTLWWLTLATSLLPVTLFQIQ